MTLLAHARRFSAPLAMLAVAFALPTGPASASNGAEIDAKADLALQRLLGESDVARAVNERAIAVLVFPDIIKAGFGIGGQYGEGALRRNGAAIGYYNLAAASFGLQIGAQSFSQAVFFMTEEVLDFLERSEGFELGADANVALANEGLGYNVTTSTIQDPIIAFVFGQQGLMAGVTLEGSKITQIER